MLRIKLEEKIPIKSRKKKDLSFTDNYDGKESCYPLNGVLETSLGNHTKT